MRRIGVVLVAAGGWVVYLTSVAAAKGPMPVTGASDRATLIVGLVFAVGFGLVAMRLRRS